MNTDIYILADTFENDLAESYRSDEFHKKALRTLEEKGYQFKRENIMEIHESDPGEVDNYLEVITEFSGDSSDYSLSFVLEDSRKQDFRPSVEFVAGFEDFSGL
ncbi:hypothetical protein AQV86_04050 [Nanohaloarchaea archaeon SG9]|nr:hypothetical protein AQV86_04050 [Nanohaloarchaea archaeon SG9]